MVDFNDIANDIEFIREFDHDGGQSTASYIQRFTRSLGTLINKAHESGNAVDAQSADILLDAIDKGIDDDSNARDNLIVLAAGLSITTIVLIGYICYLKYEQKSNRKFIKESVKKIDDLSAYIREVNRQNAIKEKDDESKQA